MKRLFALILALVMCLPFCGCSKEESKTTEQKEAKTVEEGVKSTVDEVKKTEVPKEKVCVLVKSESINASGRVIMENDYEYNDDGELVTSSEAHYTYEYEFDKNDALTEARRLEGGKVNEVYTFNDKGYITKITHFYTDNGKMGWWHEYEYDETGKVITYIDYWGSGELDDKRLYTYREDGTCEKITCYEAEDTLLYITDCDEKGMPKFTQYYNAKAPSYTYEYKYDIYGNLTETVQYFGFSTREQSRYRYTYAVIEVTALQKMIIEAKNRTSPN